MSLAGSNPRHVVMFAQIREILVELLHSLLVRFDAFTFQSFVELEVTNDVSADESV